MLRDPGPRSRLLDQLAGVDRLVLLGDVVELRHGPVGQALAQASPVLAELAQALPTGAEVVLVPGNHDHRLLAAWLSRRGLSADGQPLGLENEVDWLPGEPLAALAGALGPERARVVYPGVWLREDVYATHGHYGDRHITLPIFERLGAGVTARIVGEAPGGPSSPDGYEATLAPVYAWIDVIAQYGGPAMPGSGAGLQARVWRQLSPGRGRSDAARRMLTQAGLRTAVAALNRARIGPLRADLSGQELRRAALRGFAEVLARLDITAPHVIFGHTHRAGPLPGDDPAEWTAPGGVSLLNTGSWVHQPAFLGRSPGRSPYRAGFCAELPKAGPPRLVNLLDRPAQA